MGVSNMLVLLAAAANPLALTLLHSLWQVAALAGMVWLAMPYLPSARSRYAASCGALAASLLSALGTLAWLLRTSPAPAGHPVHSPSSTSLSVNLGAAAGVPWQLVVLFVYLLGVAVVATRLLRGAWRLRRLRASAAALVLPALDHLQSRLGLRQSVPVFACPQGLALCTYGLLRPVILVPAAMVTQLPPAVLEALLAHELAHVARRDYLLLLLQRTAEALLFFHPLVWWLSRQATQQREFLCDALAVEALSGEGNSPEAARHRVAQALFALEALLQGQPDHSELTLAASDGTLLQRVQRLVSHSDDSVRPQAPLRAAASTGVVCGILLAGLFLLAVLPASPVLAQAGGPSGQSPKAYIGQEDSSSVAGRIAIARKRFGGEHTERGRAYVAFGPPDEIVVASEHPNQATPAERWIYFQHRPDKANPTAPAATADKQGFSVQFGLAVPFDALSDSAIAGDATMVIGPALPPEAAVLIEAEALSEADQALFAAAPNLEAAIALEAETEALAHQSELLAGQAEAAQLQSLEEHSARQEATLSRKQRRAMEAATRRAAEATQRWQQRSQAEQAKAQALADQARQQAELQEREARRLNQEALAMQRKQEELLRQSDQLRQKQWDAQQRQKFLPQPKDRDRAEQPSKRPKSVVEFI